ncbi:TPA: hypothetical protein DEP58_01550 [Patescibacteria group bacterium]|nr:hypothetical protein [Patescibacteria group bacterium]
MSTELTAEQLAQLKANSGGDTIASTSLPVLNRVQLNGEVQREEDAKGNEKRVAPYWRKSVFVGKDQDAIPEKENLGTKIEVRLVKIRRKQVARDDRGATVLSTSQYSDYNQIVSVYKEGKKVAVMPANEIYSTFTDLKPRTQMEVYAIMPDGERVLFIFKGTAINAGKRPEGKPSFKQYVSALNKDGGIAFFTTKLGGVYVKDGLEFNVVTFEKGRETTTEEKLEILNWQNELDEVMRKYDENNARKDIPSTDTDSVAPELTDADMPNFTSGSTDDDTF